jgi:hydrogenase maturation protease
MTRVLVVGVGNPDCGDDGVGPYVAGEVAARALEGVRTMLAPADGLTLLDAWDAVPHVVIVDAAVSGGAPGAVHEIDAAAAPLPGTLRQVSSHGFGVVEVVELARALGRLPARVTIFGIEGEHFEPGRTMSGAVKAAAGAVVEKICTSTRS